jgi:hypothetical protein
MEYYTLQQNKNKHFNCLTKINFKKVNQIFIDDQEVFEVKLDKKCIWKKSGEIIND